MTVSHCQEKFLQLLETSVQVISYPALVRAADPMRMVRLKFGTKIFLQSRDLLWHMGGMQCICKKSGVCVSKEKREKARMEGKRNSRQGSNLSKGLGVGMSRQSTDDS